MTPPLMETPVTLNHLDKDSAVFTGSATETTEHVTMFGSYEATGHYPAIALQRDVWESLGRPTELLLTLETLSSRREASR